jgi:serine/threonine-protein kinase
MAENTIKLTGFELLELLGQGGMGVVWKAKQLSLDRLVAVKLLPPKIASDPEAVRQIMTEARTAAKLKHSGIVQVYDASEEQGTYFFVMEYVAGYSVGQWVRRSKVLKCADSLLVAESVGVALDYAWRTSGLIHCDIKPENIMVDQDGTIKVADLGLSRSSESGIVLRDGEIVGTPSYMSPEQSRGDRDIDCRTDIYSLGATMYHMITGHRMFEEKSDREAMDCVLTDKVCDPRDFVQDIPPNVCALLERMLAKDREARPRDWPTVLNDIRRVEKGAMPASKAVPAGGSTLNCRKVVVKKQTPAPSGSDAPAPPPPDRHGGLFGVVLAILIAATVAVVWYMVERSKGAGRTGSGTAPAGVATPTAPKAGPREALDEARQWARTHPHAYDQAIVRYKAVASRFPGSEEGVWALTEARVLAERRDREVGDAWTGLSNRVQKLTDKGQWNDALIVVETYNGPWAAEMVSNRTQLARGLRQKVADLDMQKTAEAKWQKLIGGIADLLMSGKILAAQQAVNGAMAENNCGGHTNDLASVLAILQGTAQLNDRIMQSFKNDMGRTLQVKLVRGELQAKIVGFRAQKVVGETAEGQAQVLFGPDELAPVERVARLGVADTPEVALVKGLFAVGTSDYAQAEALLATTGPVLSKPLVAKVRELSGAGAADPAEAALARVLAAIGAEVGPYDEAAWSAAIQASRPGKESATACAELREKFLETFGASEFAAKATPILLLLEQVCQQAAEGNLPAGDAKGNELRPGTKTQGAGNALDLTRISEALMARNPSLRGEAITACESPYGPGIVIATETSPDLTPLAGMRGLKVLRLETDGERRIPVDVRPLTASDVVELRLLGYVVKDLSCLRFLRLKSLVMPGVMAPGFATLEGLTLAELDMHGSNIKDLNPLRGMRLETLNLDDTQAGSLMTLAGMPLRNLSIRNTPVRDIGVLRTFPLENLNLAQTKAFDYQALRGLALKTLNLSGTPVRDISFCAPMPLADLQLADTLVGDISALRGKSFDVLVLAKTPVKDILPLEGATIGQLDLCGIRSPHHNLAQALAKINVAKLNLAETEVVNIEFLKGKKLTELSLKGTRVRNLDPLRDMPIEVLNIQGTGATELDALPTMKLRELWVDEQWKFMKEPRVFRAAFPGLKLINGVPLEKFFRAEEAPPFRQGEGREPERVRKAEGGRREGAP